ncbi:hypothetical protein J6590_051836 [Homalodisca vitripennis]|nr:hypothetical protein J6590_051836 [Homalodisca vitripennis]
MDTLYLLGNLSEKDGFGSRITKSILFSKVGQSMRPFTSLKSGLWSEILSQLRGLQLIEPLHNSDRGLEIPITKSPTQHSDKT